MKSQTLEEWIAEHGGQSKFFPIEQPATLLNGSQIDEPRMVRSRDGKVMWEADNRSLLGVELHSFLPDG